MEERNKLLLYFFKNGDEIVFDPPKNFTWQKSKVFQKYEELTFTITNNLVDSGIKGRLRLDFY